MRMLTVQDDGTTTIELTDTEAHALRDTLAAAGPAATRRGRSADSSPTHTETRTDHAREVP